MINAESEAYFAYITHLRGEHRQLKTCLEDVEQAWKGLRRTRSLSRGLDELISSLGGLRAVLAHHLTEEEGGGCVEEAVAHAPQLSHEVTELEHQDPGMLEQLDELIDQLRLTTRSVRKLEKDYRRLAKQISDHAAAESRIVEKSFGMEVD